MDIVRDIVREYISYLIKDIEVVKAVRIVNITVFFYVISFMVKYFTRFMVKMMVIRMKGTGDVERILENISEGVAPHGLRLVLLFRIIFLWEIVEVIRGVEVGLWIKIVISMLMSFIVMVYCGIVGEMVRKEVRRNENG